MRTKLEVSTRFRPTEELGHAKRFFLVGIGGAGLCGLAQLLLSQDAQVLGTDAVASPITDALERSGAHITIGHDAGALQAEDALILSDAIDLDSSPEVSRAHELGCGLFRRSQLLGWLLRDHKVIAVTGTHGKTTTTSLLGAAMIAAHLDPTVIVGAEIAEWQGSIRVGHSEWAVVEACEAYDGFLDLHPQIIVLTNLEADHLDFHGGVEELHQSFDDFTGRLPRSGTLVYCSEDPGATEIAAKHQGNQLHYDGRAWPTPESQAMRLPGRHNWLNARAALSVIQLLAPERLKEATVAVQNFGGAARRLELVRDEEVAVLDDYAHHPTEIAASIAAVRDRYAGRRLVAVFQPHLYSRTAEQMQGFVQSLQAVDLLVVTDIYPAREAPIPGVSAARIAEATSCETFYVPSRHQLAAFVRPLLKPGDVVLAMGAGNISDFVPQLLAELDRPRQKQLVILYGGDSAEREVSLHTGLAMEKALRNKYGVRLLDLTELLLGSGSVRSLLGSQRPDLAVLAVHGNHAEDGAIQGFLELLGIPYSHSSLQASALAMDKEKSKEIFRAANLPVPKGLQVFAHENGDDVVSRVLNEVGGDQWVVKPNAQGSTIGVTFVQNPADLGAAIAKGLHYDQSVLVEERVMGIEISTPVLGDRALLPVEIAPAEGAVYDFAAKYIPGATYEVCPARINREQTARAQELALAAHRALGCSGLTRTDMIISGDRFVLLETNTIPGLTPTSLVPRSAEACGMSFDQLCDWIVQDALQRVAH